MMVRFADVLTIINGKNQKRVENPNGQYPIYGSGGIIGYADDYICEANTVVIGRKGSINNPFFVETRFWNVDTAFGLCAKESKLLSKYLYYFCENFDFERLNTTVTIPSLTKANLLNVEITLPPLEKQHKIAAELDQISALIDKRRQQLEKLDLLVKAKFVEMFGDPVTNPKKWSITKVGEVIESIDSGWSGNGTQREKKEGEIAVLKVSAVTKGYFIPSECKVLDDQKQVKKFIFPQKGDLLFSRANTREMVGATAIVREDYPDLILPDKLWKIRFMDMANVIYMKYILSSQHIRSQFSAISTGTSGSMYNVSMEKFRNVQIPMPEIEIQNQFSVFYEQIEKTRNTISRSLEKLETLKKAQMQKYFE